MSRPRLADDVSYLPGLAAIALFVVFAAAFLSAPLRAPETFGGDAALTRSIGAALLAIDPSAVVDEGTAVAGESFLVAFILIAVVLDAALDGSLMLAKRDPKPDTMADGGSPGRATEDGEADRSATEGGEATAAESTSPDDGGDSSW